jgi:hypothetical protein
LTSATSPNRAGAIALSNQIFTIIEPAMPRVSIHRAALVLEDGDF